MTPGIRSSKDQASDPEFSLVLGGPLFNLFCRTYLSGRQLEFLSRRTTILTAVAWLPLLVLSLLAGNALPGSIPVPFLTDVETHVRFLVALPLLVGAERYVHRRLRPLVRQFVERHIVVDEELARYERLVASTLRLRNSVLAEILLLVFVYTVGLWVWRSQFALTATSWYASNDGASVKLTTAGYWYLLVSLPFFQFVLLRWYYRLFLWFWFLFRVSLLKLRLVPSHPDRTGGIGFLGACATAFTPFLVAQGAALAGLLASKIFYEQGRLFDFKVEIAAFVAFFLIFMLLPLTVFMPQLVRARREGNGKFGRLAGRYATRFEKKWFTDREDADGELLGSADLQSLADLGNSYSHVRDMRIVPFGMKNVAWLATMTLLPFLPLTLTALSLEQLTDYLIKLVF